MFGAMSPVANILASQLKISKIKKTNLKRKIILKY